jgi:hypothetical protein
MREASCGSWRLLLIDSGPNDSSTSCTPAPSLRSVEGEPSLTHGDVSSVRLALATKYLGSQIDADVDTADHLEIRDSFFTIGIEDR